MKFIDEVKIYIKSGSGGPGSVSFRREKFVPKGGPDGGDGGFGGSVIFVPDINMSTLLDFKYKRRYIAGDGEGGSGSTSTGADGKDCFIKVPVGTLIKDFETNEILFDIDSNSKKFVALKGGRGGKGNAFFKSATNQTPRKAQPGEAGESRDIVLELKLIADCGLLGKPNVGKSTLISRVSAAKPKIADYPFTTLVPNLGVVKGDIKHSFVIADIPGLIEGAHQGRGLGLKFLRHVERAKILLHVLDHVGKDFVSIKKDYEGINEELTKYKADLSVKKQIVAINKMDIPLSENLKSELVKYFKLKQKKLYFISAVSGLGLTELLREIQRELI
jgi:GTPase